MFNKIRNLFKKKEIPKESQEWYDKMRELATKRVQPINWDNLKLDKDGKYRVKSINMFPKLTKSELIALHSCMEYAIKGRQVGLNAGIRPAMTMKRLTDKGYLVRVKRELYTLSFKK